MQKRREHKKDDACGGKYLIVHTTRIMYKPRLYVKFFITIDGCLPHGYFSGSFVIFESCSHINPCWCRGHTLSN